MRYGHARAGYVVAFRNWAHSYESVRRVTVRGNVGLLHKFLMLLCVGGLILYLFYSGVWAKDFSPVTAIGLSQGGTSDGVMIRSIYSKLPHPSQYPAVFEYCSNEAYAINAPNLGRVYNAPHCVPTMNTDANTVKDAGRSIFTTTQIVDNHAFGFPCTDIAEVDDCTRRGRTLVHLDGQSVQCECQHQEALFLVNPEEYPINFQFYYKASDAFGSWDATYPELSDKTPIQTTLLFKNGSKIVFDGKVPSGSTFSVDLLNKYAKFTASLQFFLELAGVDLDQINTATSTLDPVGLHYRSSGVRLQIQVELNNRDDDIVTGGRAVKAEISASALYGISRSVAGSTESYFIKGGTNGKDGAMPPGGHVIAPEDWVGWTGGYYHRNDRTRYGIWSEFNTRGYLNFFNFSDFFEKIVVYLTATLSTVVMICNMYAKAKMPWVKRDLVKQAVESSNKAKLAVKLFTAAQLSKTARDFQHTREDEDPAPARRRQMICDALADVDGMEVTTAFAIVEKMTYLDQKLQRQKLLRSGQLDTDDVEFLGEEECARESQEAQLSREPFFLEIARCLDGEVDTITDRIDQFEEQAKEITQPVVAPKHIHKDIPGRASKERRRSKQLSRFTQFARAFGESRDKFLAETKLAAITRETANERAAAAAASTSTVPQRNNRMPYAIWSGPVTKASEKSHRRGRSRHRPQIDPPKNNGHMNGDGSSVAEGNDDGSSIAEGLEDDDAVYADEVALLARPHVPYVGPYDVVQKTAARRAYSDARGQLALRDPSDLTVHVTDACGSSPAANNVHSSTSATADAQVQAANGSCFCSYGLGRPPARPADMHGTV